MAAQWSSRSARSWSGLIFNDIFGALGRYAEFFIPRVEEFRREYGGRPWFSGISEVTGNLSISVAKTGEASADSGGFSSSTEGVLGLGHGNSLRTCVIGLAKSTCSWLSTSTTQMSDLKWTSGYCECSLTWNYGRWSVIPWCPRFLFVALTFIDCVEAEPPYKLLILAKRVIRLVFIFLFFVFFFDIE